MIFFFNLYTSVLLIFFTHLLVYAFMFYRRGIRQDNNADKLLAVFLVLSALFVFPWMVGFAGWYDNQPYREILFYTPFVQGLFLGPVLYFYVKSITNYRYVIKGADLLHFVPGILYLVWSIIVVVADKFVAGRYYLMNGSTDPDFDTWYQYLWLISLITYLVLSIRYYRLYSLFIPSELSFSELAAFTWLKNFLYAFALLAVASFVINIILLFTDLGYWNTWYYYLLFVLTVYYIAINGFNISKIPLHKLFFEPKLLSQYSNPEPKLLPPPQSEAGTIEETKDNQEDILSQWKIKVEQVMETEKMYQRPALTLTELAKELGTNTSLLSRVINQCFKLNFNDYINSLRVEDAVRKMQDPAFANQTLLSIAFDSGFNSKSTFNRAFLKFKGAKPKDIANQSVKGSKS